MAPFFHIPTTTARRVRFINRMDTCPTVAIALTKAEDIFSDANDIADYAKESICWLTNNNVITGKGENILDPKGLATRAETAKIMQKITEFLEK